MEKLFVIILMFISITVFAQEKPDSIQIKNYDKRINELQEGLQKRIMTVAQADPTCNQLQGAIAVLKEMRDPELKKKLEPKK